MSALVFVVVLPSVKLTNMIANGNLVLESTGPTLAIIGNGGIYVDRNTISGSPYINSNAITFNFSESIRDGSFTIDDIGIVNDKITQMRSSAIPYQ
jgi:hypothetical protein